MSQVGIKKISIYLNNANPNLSYIRLDDHLIYGVFEMELRAGAEATWPPKLILTLTPDVITIEGVADVQGFLNIPQDRFKDLED